MKKRGLVLGGGGAKGCFEIGACQAFQECGIHFDVVTGTSIGALVGAMVAQGNIEPLVDFVYDLEPGHVIDGFFDLPENFLQLLSEANQIHSFVEKYVSENGSDITPLRTAFQAMFDYDTFVKSDIDYGCMTFNLDQLKGEPFTKETMDREHATDIILASAACYPAMPMIEINGEKHIDGGYYDNVPIELAIDMGVEDILAIRLRAPGIFHERKYNIPVRVIEPILLTGNFLDFDHQQGLRSLRTGYLEMMKHMGKFEGFFYTLEKRSENKIKGFEQYASNLKDIIEMDSSFIDELYKEAFGYVPPSFTTKYHEKYSYWCVLECMAYKQGMDPVNLYSWGNFISQLIENGKLKDRLEITEKDGMFNKVYNFVYHALIQYVVNAKEDTE